MEKIIKIGGVVVNETDPEKMKKRIVEDVERIVNDQARQEAINAFHKKRKEKRQNKLLTDAVVYAAISLAFGLCGCFHIMAAWVAFPVMAACGLYATFIFGRWYEHRNNWGCF